MLWLVLLFLVGRCMLQIRYWHFSIVKVWVYDQLCRDNKMVLRRMFVGLLEGVVGALVKVALNWSLIKLVVYLQHMWLLCILALDHASSVFDAFGAMMEAVRETSFKSMLLLVISSLINNIVFSTNVF